MQTKKMQSYLVRSTPKLLLFEAVTAEQLLDRIKRDLYILGAKEAGGVALKTVVEEFGEDIVNTVMDGLGAVPFVGNAVSALKGLWSLGKIGKKGFAAVKNAKVLAKPAMDLLNIAAGKYAGMDDNDVGSNPLAKILNIDDRMELPIKDAYLKDFAGKFVKYLKDNPGASFEDEESAAETALGTFLQKGARTEWEDAEGPADPN